MLPSVLYNPRVKPTGWEMQVCLLTSTFYENVKQVIHLLAGTAILLGRASTGLASYYRGASLQQDTWLLALLPHPSNRAVTAWTAHRPMAPDSSMISGCYWRQRCSQQLL